MEPKQGVTLSAIYMFLYAIISFCLSLILVSLIVIPFLFVGDKEVTLIIGFVGVFAFIITFLYTLLFIICAFGLLAYNNIARWGTVILCALNLFSFFPISLIGLLCIIHLLSEDTAKLFRS